MAYKSDIVYGPVDSRRLGRSLGINLSPMNRKICSFDCTYCSGGSTKLKTLAVDPEATFPLEFVREELEMGFDYHSQNRTPIDYVSIAGATEPTIYPQFHYFCESFSLLVSKYFSDMPTAIFTNSTNLDKDEVKSSLQLFNRRFFKLDAGDEETFQRINRPAENINLGTVVENLAKIQDVELSTGIIDGSEGNYYSLRNGSFIQIVQRIRPVRIYIYDMDRPVPTENGFEILRTDYERLADLADYLSGKVETEIIVLRTKKSRGIHELVRNRYFNCGGESEKNSISSG